MKKPMISHHVASAASGLRHVFVRDLDLMALIGIYDHEKVDPQRIIVNIDLSVHEGDGPQGDDIGHVVSYEIVVKKVETILAEAWGPRIARVVQGGPEVARDFAAQPWDHLVFTGGTEIGRKVMAAAAPNLTPLTLELGGKSPDIVFADADLAAAARGAVRLSVGRPTMEAEVEQAAELLLARVRVLKR